MKMNNPVWKLLVFMLLVGQITNARTAYFFSDSSVVNFEKRLLPVPQKVELTAERSVLDRSWMIDAGSGTGADDIALTSLQNELKERYQFQLGVRSANTTGDNGRSVISLIVKPGSVAIGQATDTNRTALEAQAYRLTLAKNKITITANASAGVFYGVQTLLQLLQKENEQVVFVSGEIVDWPDMNMRIIYWDDAHHLEYLDVLKREIRQAAYFKINGFALKLEGHFQFESAKPVTEPHALSPAQYQELTDYAKSYYMQLIPYLDGPAHVSFILKHPEYLRLRAFPNSNYQLNATDPQTEKLLLGMFDDLINANKGVEYIVLSNDEAYYTGKSPYEIEAAKAAGGNGKLLAQFIKKIADELNKRGRKVIFWGEYPLTLSDIKTLPGHMVDGVYDSAWASAFREQGMRQLLYAPIQGEEPLFPNYYPLPATKILHPENLLKHQGNVNNVLETVTSAIRQKKADLMGVIIAGWADAGLHPETFWLGYAAGAATGWNSRSVTAKELSDRFYLSFYRSGGVRMDRVYELLSGQAQFFEDSWEWEPSSSRTGIFGNHAEIYKTPKPALDQTIPFLSVPQAKTLKMNSSWSAANTKRLQLAESFLKENDELLNLLNQNLRSVEHNRNNIEVLLSVAKICRQNLELLQDLQRMDQLLGLASDVAPVKPAVALSLIDQSVEQAGLILKNRNEVLNSVINTWYQDWRPLVMEANGRRYLHQVDDVKDHRPIRTSDMSYLVYRQLRYPLQKWVTETMKVRNAFAEQNKLKTAKYDLPWSTVE